MTTETPTKNEILTSKFIGELPELRDEFEKQLDYRLGAMVNLRKSKAWPIETLRAI